MKIALSVYEKKISPVFDFASLLSVYEKKNEKATMTNEINLVGIEFNEKIRILKQNEIELIICGAVSNQFRQLIEMEGIKLIPWVCGSVEEIINVFLKNKLDNKQYFMPGCGRRGNRNRFRKGR